MSDWKPLPEQVRPSLTGPVLVALQGRLHEVAQQTIDAVAQEVPGYRGTLDEAAQAILAQAVELALSGFLSLAAADQDPSAPLAPALQGAFALGQGEARLGRPMDALLAAYRVGARVSWRGLAGAAVEAGLPAEEVVLFAELVFAYIDALSAASVAGHADELAVADRVLQRSLERLAHGLLIGSPVDSLQAAAQRAEWIPPVGLVAVVLPEPRVADVVARIDSRTLQPVDDIPGLEPGAAALLVPDPDARFHAGLARGLDGEGAVVGPLRPWTEARGSFERALRGWRLGLAGPLPAAALGSGTRGSGRIVDTEEVLPELLVAADPAALADLRARALAPLADLRPAAADRLIETLGAWLLHRGRRDEVAAALFVHPQTVRYRMGQVRALYGDSLDDPRVTLELTLALTLAPEAREAHPER
ncbi:MAG TPA: helix-turn-helix domain-containing protein [Motilibacterales bacterium]|nr:helix-turn-helix domain-containing protein [Motilibacterales bacterium]